MLAKNLRRIIIVVLLASLCWALGCSKSSANGTDAGNAADTVTGGDTLQPSDVQTPNDTLGTPDTGDDAQTQGGDTPGLDAIVPSGAFPSSTGSFSVDLTIDGVQRKVEIYVPTSAIEGAPLVIALHGTSGGGNDWIDSDPNSDPSGLEDFAQQRGAIIVAPYARYWPDGVGDWDNHSGNDRYWETRLDSDPTRGSDPTRNNDLVLLRTIIAEAKAAWKLDPKRIYLLGHSNGGYFATHAAFVLRDEIAAFASNASGLVTCAHGSDCDFQGTGTTCDGFVSQSGTNGSMSYAQCQSVCNGTPKPIAVPTSGRLVPGYLSHNGYDDIVSVFHTCTLYGAMTKAGYDVKLTLFSAPDNGHSMPENWLQEAFDFFDAHTLP